MIPKNQTDLSDNGTFFSLVVIYLMNLLLLSAMLVLASPRITFASFGADIVRNIANFAHAIVTLCERFTQRAVTQPSWLSRRQGVLPESMLQARCLHYESGWKPAVTEHCERKPRQHLRERKRRMPQQTFRQ